MNYGNTYVHVTIVWIVGMAMFLLGFGIFMQWNSQPCPRCGSKWRTQIAQSHGSYGVSWFCHRCKLSWFIRGVNPRQ